MPAALSLTHLAGMTFRSSRIINNRFKIQMLNSYHEYYNKLYTAKGWTSTHALCLLIAYIILALPFYFCFAGTNFWTDTHSTLMTVNYNYTGFYAVQVNYLSGSTTLTDEYSNIPGNSMTSPLSTVRSVSLTTDDQRNTTSAALVLNGYSSLTVLSTNAILYFDVQIESMQKIVSQAISLSIPGNINSGAISGTLRMEGNQPISGMSSGTNVNLPMYYPYQSTGYTFSKLSTYLSQNNGFLKTATQSSYTYGGSTSSSITINLNKVKSTTINYYPGILQTFKFKYSSYLAFAIISYFVFSTLFKLFVNEGMLESQTQVEKIRST